MDILPKYRLRLPFAGEGHVYRLLAAMEVPGAFAIHSLNLPHHEYKRWSEADFVVVTPSEVTLLEVKGGEVDFIDRVWRYCNARGEAIESREGPARQALSAASTLEKEIRAILGSPFRVRWGVVFPFTRFTDELRDLPPNRIADCTVCTSLSTFAQWFHSLPTDALPGYQTTLTPAEVALLRETLVPAFHAACAVGLAADAVHERIIQLTTQQAIFLEGLRTNPRLLVIGGAGTGKTELAILAARAELADGRHPVLITASPLLARGLAARLDGSGIPVCSGVPSALPGDVAIVDEGQDFALEPALTDLFRTIPGGMKGGRWRWFMDPNLQFVEHPPDVACLAQLRGAAVSYELTRNVRTTREVVSSVRMFLKADVGISEIDGFGIRVELARVSSIDAEYERASRIIDRLLEDGLRPTGLAILGPHGESGPVGSRIARRYTDVVRPFSPENLRNAGNHGIITSIAAFRGFEADAAILVDLDLLDPGERGKAALYVGMTRARTSLHLMVSDRVKARLADYLMED